jgi:hypothetical protein
MAKRVYFGFHYQDVIDFRANVVRKHNLTGGVEKAGYYDHSIWEESKKKGDIALKRMINSELEGTSVTVILIGSDTYARRWVRYEITRSLARGNGLVGIHINGIKGKDQLTKAQGPKPFDYLGVSISDDGTRGTPIEWKAGKWQEYRDHEGWALAKQHSVAGRGKRFKLSHWYPTYDWLADDGFQKFSSWIA